MQEEEFPTKIVMIGGKRIALYQLGQGDPIILLHGLIARGAWSLKHLAKRLSEHFLVIGIHLPGYEGSQEYRCKNYRQLAKIVIRVLQRLGIQGKFYVFGASTGGTIAIVMASEFSEKIAKVALFEAPFSKSNVRTIWRVAALFAFLPGFVWVLRQILTRTGMKDFQGAKSRVPMGPLIRIGKILTESDFSAHCQRITHLKIPVLLAFGQKSGVLLSLGSMKEIRRILPHAQEIEMPGTVHSLPREPQEILADYLVPFFSK